MKYLRMLSNALVAGALASAYVIVLILQLNPTLPLNLSDLGALTITVGPFYAASCAVIVYALLLLQQLFGRQAFSPAWISITVLAWSSSLTAAVGALLMWANIRTFSLVLETGTIEALAGSAVILAATSLLLLPTAVLQRYRWRRPLWAAWVVCLTVVSVVAPLSLRGRGPARGPEIRALTDPLDVPSFDPSAHVTVIALDAGSLEVITNATAEGRLPNFGRILDAGAVTHLATLHPTSAEAVWAATATGKLPQKNGVRSAAVYRVALRSSGYPIELLPDFCFATGLVRFGILTQESPTSASIRSRTLWTILSAAGVSVGVVNFPLTDPAPAVRGFVVSDAYVRLATSPSTAAGSAPLYPPALADEAERVLRSSSDDSMVPPVLNLVAERHRTPARTDRAYEQLSVALRAIYPVDVSLLRFQSPDPIGHYFLRYAMPSRFGDVSDEDRRQFGGILEAHYAMVDAAIGRAIGDLGPSDLLLVVSGYGMEPLSVGKRVLEQVIGDPEISGTHEGAPDGFLMAYGGSVAKARQLRRGSVVDVLPTILYFLGLPVARDMDGYARTDLFVPAFTEERPIAFIPTYDR